MEESREDKYIPPPIAEVPWLIATHENQKCTKLEKQTFRTNKKSYIKTIQELDRNIITSSHQGWLILIDREDCTVYSLYNPATSRFISLPELPLDHDPEEDYIEPSTCLFTSPLDDNDDDNNNNNPEDCVLVLFFSESLVFTCRPALQHNCSWVKHMVELDGLSVRMETAAVLERVIYGYARIGFDEGAWRCKFVRLQVSHDNDSNSITLEPMTIELEDFKFQNYQPLDFLLESCGDLYYIHFLRRSDDDDDEMDIIKVFVWRLDSSHTKWTRVECLGNRAFLLSMDINPRNISSSTWCWAQDGSSSPEAFIEGNCVYLAIWDKLYSYNLQDDSYTILLPHSTFLNNFYGPTWFMPRSHQRSFPFPEWMSQVTIDNERIEHFQNIIPDIQEHVEDFQAPSSLLPSLPNDLLQSITKQMNLFDYMDIRATCKKLREAITPLSQWQPRCPYPLFMVRKDNSGAYELMDPIQNTSRTIAGPLNSPTILSNFEYCKDGWLLLRTEGDCLYYFNPLTRETRKHPACSMHYVASYGFTTCPTSSGCLTVGIDTQLFLDVQLEHVIISCFENAKGEWKYHKMEFDPNKDLTFLPNHKSSPKYHKNTFYFLGCDGSLGELQINQGQLKWQVHKSPFTKDEDEDEDVSLRSCYLVELDGKLVAVFIGDFGTWVRVFHFNISDKCWRELHSLDDHVLFVSPASSFSAKLINNDEINNRIYLPLRLDNEVVYYSLDTSKYHTSSSSNSMDNFYGMKAQLSCCWVSQVY